MLTEPTSNGPLSSAQKRWQQAADDLSPEKSLARAAANGRFLVGLVVVISSLLTGFGSIALSGLDLGRASRWAVAGVLLLVTAALGLALSSLVLRSRAVAIGDLQDVERWYLREFRRMRRVAWAGWLLVAALVVSGVLGAVLVLNPPDRPGNDKPPPCTGPCKVRK